MNSLLGIHLTLSLFVYMFDAAYIGNELKNNLHENVLMKKEAHTFLGDSNQYWWPTHEDKHKEAVREKKDKLRKCIYSCYNNWSVWTPCDRDCFGQISRARQVKSECKEFDRKTGCNEPRVEVTFCNQKCYNQGMLLRNKCVCEEGFTGQCCQKEILCEDVNDLENGMITATKSNRLGSTLDFSCHEGFTLIGDKKSICQADGSWSNPKPVCEKVITCDSISSLENGEIYFSNKNNFNSTRTFFCDKDFKLIGEKQSTCLIDGSWSHPMPICQEEIQCQNFGSIENGVIFSSHENHIGSVLKFSCNYGFKLIGKNQSICQRDGSWSDSFPVCEEIFCEDINELENGMIIATHKNLIGSKLHFICNRGFTLLGETQSICLSDGSWSHPIPICQVESQCQSYGSLENGVIFSSHGSHIGSVLRFSCNSGFNLIGETRSICESDGSWSNSFPVCEEIKCERINFLENGKVTVTNTNHIGSRLTFTCYKGFNLIGARQSICGIDGSWSNTKPVCQAQEMINFDCEKIDGISNGMVKMTNENHNGSVASFDCIDNFRLEGHTSIWCQKDGKWSDNPPKCIPVVAQGDKRETSCCGQWVNIGCQREHGFVKMVNATYTQSISCESSNSDYMGDVEAVSLETWHELQSKCDGKMFCNLRSKRYISEHHITYDCMDFKYTCLLS